MKAVIFLMLALSIPDGHAMERQVDVQPIEHFLDHIDWNTLPGELKQYIIFKLAENTKIKHFLDYGLVSKEVKGWIRTHRLCEAKKYMPNDDRVHPTPAYLLANAADKGQFAIVKALIESGVDVNARGYIGDTALTRAASSGHQKIVELLISHGAHIEAQALWFAVIKNNKEITELLIAHGVDVNTQETSTGNTALLLAAQRGYTDMVKLLIQSGATIDTKDASGETALHKAIKSGQANTVNLLLANNALA